MASSRENDEYKRLRLASGRRLAIETSPPVAGGPSFVGQVTSKAANIAVGQFLMVQPACVLGAEAEGGGGTFAAGSGSNIPVYLIGPASPATGEYLICRFVDHRWVAERMSNAGVAGPPPITIPACSCPIPAHLTMTSVVPSCNYGMFQTGTLSYQATPSWAARLGLGSMIFLGDRSFYDPIGRASFYYYLYCQSNVFALTRLYPTSPYGSPYRDALLYSWLLAGYGNSCNPFRLEGGKPYPGSDQTCSVLIDPA